MFKSGFLVASAIVAFLLASSTLSASALTVEELRADAKLTPESFIKQFADFKFSLGRTVQAPENFLAAKAGDCDDFATLAAEILRQKGYTCKLIAVFMPRDTHVVCYVKETNSYLDFNCRKKSSPMVNCEGHLSDVAKSVAASFRSSWMSASEFTLQTDGGRHFVQTEFH